MRTETIERNTARDMKRRRRRRFRASLFLSVGVEIVPAKKFTAAVFLHTFSTAGKSMSRRAATARWKRENVLSCISIIE